jgi:hypothetical protein
MDIKTNLSLRYICRKVNSSMQDCVQTITGLTEEFRALKGKLKLWKRKMEDSKIQSFPRIKHFFGFDECLSVHRRWYEESKTN